MIKGVSQTQAAVNPRLAVERDKWGRPLIQAPDGEITPYTRASSLGKVLADETGLTRWKQRMAVIGVASRPDLVLAVLAHRADKDKITEIVEQGMAAAEASAAATTGTALHELCDQYDRGETPYVPEQFAADITAYRRATSALEVVVSEEFAVCDELKVGGTPDRIYRLLAPLRDAETGEELVPAGELVIGDIKTGASLDFGHIGYSVQLAVYSRSTRYDLSAGRTVSYRGREVPVGERSDWVAGETVNASWGVIIHLPAGTGQATVHPVDLTTGWQLAQLAAEVRQWRRRRDIIRPATELVRDEDFVAVCDSAASLGDLMAAYHRAVAAGAWDDALRVRFSQRKAELLQGGAA